jgi:hypothetical protein
MKYIVAFGRFWWDFIVGDDWRIAAGVVAALAVGAILVGRTDLSDTAVSLISGAFIFAAVSVTILGRALATARKEK